MLSKLTACFAAATSFLLSVSLPVLAKPVDGYFSTDYHFGSYLDIRNGLVHIPRDLWGVPFAQSGFIEISPYMIKKKSTGEYYCSDRLKLSNGRTAEQEEAIFNKGRSPYETGRSFRCTANGWQFYENPPIRIR